MQDRIIEALEEVLLVLDEENEDLLEEIKDILNELE